MTAPAPIHYSLDPSLIDTDLVWNLLRTSYWSPNIRRDIVQTAINNSIVIGAYDSATRQQLAFARVISDRATHAYLCDVIVAEHARGKGIGTHMVRLLMQHPDLQTVRRWALATRDAHGVYAPLGFVPVPADRWMERKMDPARWSASPHA